MTICCISFHPCRSITKQIWPCHKTGQGQPSVIIWTNVVVLEYLMLHTKFQGHPLLGSEEGDFWRFLTINGLGSHLGHVTQNIWTNFHPNIPWGRYMKFGFNRTSVFWGKEVLKCWIWVTLDKGQWMTMTFDIHKGSCTNLVDILFPEKKIFKGFYYIWAWRPYWSCDLDHLNKLSFPHPMEDTHEIWLQSA